MGKWERGGAGTLRPKADRDPHVGPQPRGCLNTRMLITEASNRLLGGAVLLLRRPQDVAQSTAAPGVSMNRPVRVRIWVEENRDSFLPPVCNKLL